MRPSEGHDVPQRDDSSGLTLRESGVQCQFTDNIYLVTEVKCVLSIDGVKLCHEIAEDRWGLWRRWFLTISVEKGERKDREIEDAQEVVQHEAWNLCK